MQKLNDQARIGLGLASLAFGMDRIVPAKEHDIEERDAKLESLLEGLPPGNNWADAAPSDPSD